PTEYEWEAAALANRPGEPRRVLPWGATVADTARGDLGAQALGTASVDDHAAGDGPFGLRQSIGTAWEWTASQFLPYDGFKVDMYPFMSTLQFGYHKTTKGGSCATDPTLIRGTYRQAYLPFRRDAFTGFRTCAREKT
ncbi:MAG: ergothioneine biosynthesis protein EgtB, partial [Gammaproteobacteria bacterium]